MARVLYVECFAGAAGDMVLGALIDAGLPIDGLRRALGSLGVEHELEVTRVVRAGVSATHVKVAARSHERRGHDRHDHGPHHHGHHAEGHGSTGARGHHLEHGEPHRSLREIENLIGHSALSAVGKARAVALFGRLAQAEAAIHGISIDDVHLHEVGALDSIIDIVGAVHGMEWFGIDDVVASPLNVGSGTVEMAHGTYPVPAPATLRLLTGVPVYSTGVQAELVTPTGALLVSDYARSYGPMPPMAVERIGYGAGTRDLGDVPNVLRVVVGERRPLEAAGHGGQAVVEIACEIDDMSPQLFGPVSERLFAAGALDVFLTAVQMKKGRPGTLVTILAPVDRRETLTDIVFRETTTLGVRYQPAWRDTLDRRWEEVAIEGGTVRIKIASRRGEVLNASPEFEDCVRVAASAGRPVKLVQAEALRAWLDRARR